MAKLVQPDGRILSDVPDNYVELYISAGLVTRDPSSLDVVRLVQTARAKLFMTIKSLLQIGVLDRDDLPEAQIGAYKQLGLAFEQFDNAESIN